MRSSSRLWVLSLLWCFCPPSPGVDAAVDKQRAGAVQNLRAGTCRWTAQDGAVIDLTSVAKTDNTPRWKTKIGASTSLDNCCGASWSLLYFTILHYSRWSFSGWRWILTVYFMMNALLHIYFKINVVPFLTWLLCSLFNSQWLYYLWFLDGLKADRPFPGLCLMYCSFNIHVMLFIFQYAILVVYFITNIGEIKTDKYRRLIRIYDSMWSCVSGLKMSKEKTYGITRTIHASHSQRKPVPEPR